MHGIDLKCFIPDGIIVVIDVDSLAEHICYGAEEKSLHNKGNGLKEHFLLGGCTILR